MKQDDKEIDNYLLEEKIDDNCNIIEYKNNKTNDHRIYEYDENNNMRKCNDLLNSLETTHQYEYDENNNCIYAKFIEDKYELWKEYNDNNKDSNNYEEWHMYDKNNNLICDKNNEGRKIEYKYDEKID